MWTGHDSKHSPVLDKRAKNFLVKNGAVLRIRCGRPASFVRDAKERDTFVRQFLQHKQLAKPKKELVMSLTVCGTSSFSEPRASIWRRSKAAVLQTVSNPQHRVYHTLNVKTSLIVIPPRRGSGASSLDTLNEEHTYAAAASCTSILPMHSCCTIGFQRILISRIPFPSKMKSYPKPQTVQLRASLEFPMKASTPLPLITPA